MKDHLREELIKQFNAEVCEVTKPSGEKYYACPTCKRTVARSDTRCSGCGQALSWNSIRQEDEKRAGMAHATLRFEVPGDFSAGDCRRCPLSYIAKRNDENVYECPLRMQNRCGLEVS